MFIPTKSYGDAVLCVLMWPEDGQTHLPTLFIQEEVL